jgi:hypothetical protein
MTAPAQLPPMPPMQAAVKVVQSPRAVSLKAMVASPQTTGIQTTNVSAPQNLSVTTTAGVNVALFVRTSNEWNQVSGDLLNWLNLSKLKANVTLAWNASTDSSVTGYNVYYGGKSGTYTNEICAGSATNLTIAGMIQNTTYYFVATCYTGAGLESQFSTEVVYTIPISTTRFKVPGQ